MRKQVRKLPSQIQQRANLKLVQIDSATELAHLSTPPSNRLEKLRGNLKKYHSIRINQQWRVIFIWENGNASDVTITDYH